MDTDPPSLLLAIPDPATRLELRTRLRGDFVMLEEFDDGVEVMESMEELRPGVVLVDEALPSLGGLEVARRLSESHPEILTVVLAGARDVDTVRAAMEAGARDVVFRPVDPEAVHATLTALVERQRRREAVRERRLRLPGSGIWSFLGATGGVGRTTLLLALATVLRQRGREVAVVDLDLLFGDVAFYLGLQGRHPSLADLLREPRFLERSVLLSHLRTDPESEIRALVPPVDLDEAYSLDPARIVLAVTELARVFDVVLVDAPVGVPHELLKLLDRSQDVFLVGNAALGSLKNLRALLVYLRRLQVPVGVLHPVLTSFDSNPQEVEEFNKLLRKIHRDEAVRFLFPADAAVATRAVTLARPVPLVAPQSRFTQSVHEFLDHLLVGDDDPEDELAPRKQLGLLESLLG